jgi:hypothetical protein
MTLGKQSAILQDVLPLSVIVKNRTSRHIVAIAILYHLRNMEGQPVWHKFFLGSLSRQRSRTMAPQQVRFICPVPVVYDPINRGQISRISQVSDSETAEVRRRLARYANQPSIRVALDAVVFEDGELIGPDESHTLATLNSWIRAERELRTLAPQKTAAEIKAHLEEILRRPRKPAANPLELDQFESRLQDLARAMLGDLNVSEQHFRNRLAASADVGISQAYRRTQ